MTALIISGNYNFESGLQKYLKLITRESCNVEHIDFEKREGGI